ncbi:hypothetical protein Tco_0343890 [Tanacetum coccineum]
MDNEPMWAADRVVALTLGLTITIPETANEIAIKGNHLTLVKGNQFDGRIKTNPHKHITNVLEGKLDDDGGLMVQAKKGKLEQTSSAFLSDESSAMIQNKVPLKLEDSESFFIPCTFSKTFSCNALADLGARINLMAYSLYAKLFLLE